MLNRSMLKRVWGLFLAISLSVVLLGCPGGGDDASNGNAPADDTGAATGGIDDGAAATGSGFKQGVGSGRAEDGSDEDK